MQIAKNGMDQIALVLHHVKKSTKKTLVYNVKVDSMGTLQTALVVLVVIIQKRREEHVKRSLRLIQIAMKCNSTKTLEDSSVQNVTAYITTMKIILSVVSENISKQEFALFYQIIVLECKMTQIVNSVLMDTTIPMEIAAYKAISGTKIVMVVSAELYRKTCTVKK